MKGILSRALPVLLVTFLASASSVAAGKVETFEIEGLTSAASPKALTTGLESKLKVKVVSLDLKNTDSGWPVLSVEFDSGQVSRKDIERAIAAIKDPAGHNYRVHKGPPISNAPFTKEEEKAMKVLGPAEPKVPSITNPIKSSDESRGRGKKLYESNCSVCHGLNGGGQGPSAHGITTFPRQLWAWSGTDSSTDGYLYWFITNGRNEMPPWGLVLSENERWDLINYIKSLKRPK